MGLLKSLLPLDTPCTGFCKTPNSGYTLPGRLYWGGVGHAVPISATGWGNMSFAFDLHDQAAPQPEYEPNA
jgi:hypothetical protein